MNRFGGVKFFLKGLPFLSIIAGGTVGLYFVQQVRFDFRKSKRIETNCELLKEDLSGLGIQVKKNVSIDSVLKEVEELDTEHWENIRGPREFEDNSEFLEAKRKREESLAKRRRTVLKGGEEL